MKRSFLETRKGCSLVVHIVFRKRDRRDVPSIQLLLRRDGDGVKLLINNLPTILHPDVLCLIFCV